MSPAELTAMLHDIAAPPAPAWWLPGPGHWLLLAVPALGLAALWGRRWWRRRHYWRRLAAAELARIERGYDRHGDTLITARELSAWLRRVSLLAFPGSSPASLVGDEWLRYLDRQCGGEGFQRGAGRALGHAIYRHQATLDPAALIALCERWLSAVAPALRRRAPP